MISVADLNNLGHASTFTAEILKHDGAQKVFLVPLPTKLCSSLSYNSHQKVLSDNFLIDADCFQQVFHKLTQKTATRCN